MSALALRGDPAAVASVMVSTLVQSAVRCQVTTPPARIAAISSLTVMTTGLAGRRLPAAIHSATASFEDQARFTNILGGKFANHGPVEEFEITPIFSESNLFQGIPGFTVKDELYIHDLQPDIEVHFATVSASRDRFRQSMNANDQRRSLSAGHRSCFDE